MSDAKYKVKSNKVGITISDGNVSSQSTHFPIDMSSSSNKQNCIVKSDEEEVAFDSGIISESNLSVLSSGVISETDIKCADFSAEFGDETNVVSEKVGQSEGETFSCDNIREETEDSMRLDSGIDIDVSDQFSGSKTDTSSSIEKGISPTIHKEFKSFKESVSTQPSTTLNNRDVCELIFQQDDENGDTQLHLAVIQGCEELVKNILQIIPDSHYLDIKNYYRQTCLHLSVIMNQPNITRLLLLAGAKTGIEDRNGNTALHLACQANHLECVIALLQSLTVYEKKYITFKYKPEIDSPSEYLNEYNYDGLSCVHIAAVHNDLKILHQLLFLYGADVNIRECKSGYTVLHEAVKCGNFNLVNYILQHSGIDIDKRNYARLTPYQLSLYYPTIGQILLDRGASQLCRFDEESDDEDDFSSSDENDNDDDYYDTDLQDVARINQMSNMIHSLSTNDNPKHGTALYH